MARKRPRFFQFPWRSRTQIARDVDAELAFSSRDACRRAGGAGDESGRRECRNPRRVRRYRVHAGVLPRRRSRGGSLAAHRRSPRRVATGHGVCVAHAEAQPGVRGGIDPHARARHRSEHRNLQRRAKRPAEATPIWHSGLAGGNVRIALHEGSDATRRALEPEPGRLPRAAAHARGNRRLLHAHRHLAVGQLRPANRDHHQGDGEYVRCARRRGMARANVLER